MSQHFPSRLQLLARIALPLLFLAFALGGCAVATSSRTPTPPPETPVPAASTPTAAAPGTTATPDSALLLKDGGIAIFENAFARLMDEYIEPVNSSRLLNAAWTSLGQEADAEGLALPEKPAFSDDRASDLALFRGVYVRLTASVADATKLRYSAIKGMAAALQDCHTYFLNPVAADTLVDTRAGTGAVGIGIELAGIPPLVTEVVEGGPAARAGILVGDRITAVNDTDASALGPAAAFDLINGHEGTPVRLRLRRPASDAPVDVSAVRERVVPKNIESHLIDGHIGYARIRNFIDGGVAKSLRETLTALDAQGATSWIIDVRDNPGGRLDSEAISLFVKDGVIVRDRGRDGTLEEEPAKGDPLPALPPTVLLVNNRTGSVAEIFAAALQEYGATYVIGAVTNGCVGFTDVAPLGDGSSLAVATHVNLGPVSGRALNGQGVVPDEQVTRTLDDIANGRDPQLDAAVAHLTPPP
jgi:carboxyl-terminal processing protease